MGIKDQNMLAKVYFHGELITSDSGFIATIDAVLTQSTSTAEKGRDEYDHLWYFVWHKAKVTSGFQVMSATFACARSENQPHRHLAASVKEVLNGLR